MLLTNLVQYFMSTQDEMEIKDKVIGTILHKALEGELLSKKFLFDWKDKNIKTDKSLPYHSKSKEKEFKKLAEEFLDFIADDSDSGSSSSSDEEETKEEEETPEQKAAREQQAKLIAE